MFPALAGTFSMAIFIAIAFSWMSLKWDLCDCMVSSLDIHKCLLDFLNGFEAMREFDKFNYSIVFV